MIERREMFGHKTAIFSDDEVHRVYLSRWVGLSTRRLLSIGLNPSKATHEVDDNTIRKETKFARRWSFGLYEKVNLFGYRSTDPRGLLDVDDPTGDPENLQEIVRRARSADLVLCTWGGPYGPAKLARLVQERAVVVVRALVEARVQLHVLALTRDGIPRHPLYLKDSSTPVLWLARGS